MRGSFRTIVIELPDSQQVWSSGDVGTPLVATLEKLTGKQFGWYPTAGAMLIVPKDGHGESYGVVDKLNAIRDGCYVTPEHAPLDLNSWES